jgi:hypothetical protein
MAANLLVFLLTPLQFLLSNLLARSMIKNIFQLIKALIISLLAPPEFWNFVLLVQCLFCASEVNTSEERRLFSSSYFFGFSVSTVFYR